MLPKEHFALTEPETAHRPSDLLLRRKDGHPGQQRRSVIMAPCQLLWALNL